jgi:hypothetical protein
MPPDELPEEDELLDEELVIPPDDELELLKPPDEDELEDALTLVTGVFEDWSLLSPPPPLPPQALSRTKKSRLGSLLYCIFINSSALHVRCVVNSQSNLCKIFSY